MEAEPFTPPARWTVSALTRYVRQLLETDYRLQDLTVEGEVSNLRVMSGSGHAYFTLKDAGAELACVMWRSDVLAQQARGLAMPSGGERVVAQGRLGVYEARGQYQLVCRALRPAGLGDLHAQFEALKARLGAEGLFDPARKRPLPDRPQGIGIVTGPQTAALQDVLTVIGRRNPLARAILAPASVQGEAAPPQIVAALAALNAHPAPEVILLVRGGGSLEDLWCFNDERVVRAIAASRLPVITGVGHETDFTLADFAADLRAPTPSAAAELVTPVTADDWRLWLAGAAGRLADAFAAGLADRRRQVDRAGLRLDRASPHRAIAEARQRVDDLLERAGRSLRGQAALRRARLAGLTHTLAAVSPEATLARGYAIVQGPEGGVLRRAAAVAPGDRLAIRLAEGRLRATVDPPE